ncbi:MAG: ACT domain-containing protein [Erysipelotrichaceae bacterium]|nr:ACT domain-containing protein [Erysipelotrichaceae bacterium]
MRTIISVVGMDRPGILALVSSSCAEKKGNIVDVSQTVLQDVFTMMMICELDENQIKLTDFVDYMEAIGKKNNLSIHVMHEDIFNCMHTI